VHFEMTEERKEACTRMNTEITDYTESALEIKEKICVIGVICGLPGWLVATIP
jgi:hypothetical protein